MAIYDIVIGDYSGDGHGDTRVHYLDVSDNVTRDDLFANYRANATRFGFTPGDFADEYEDSKIPAAWLDALLAAGLVITDTFWTADGERSDDGSTYYINEPIMFQIVTFFFTDGLPQGTTWAEYKVKSENIIGWHGINNEYQDGGHGGSGFVGYGVTGQ